MPDRLPQTWGWTGFSLIILAIVLTAIWAFGRFLDWLVPGEGGKLLLVALVLLPIGIALFASSETRDTVFGDSDEANE